MADVVIIGLNAKIGGGKDTVAKIIQDLTRVNVSDYITIKDGKMLPMKGGSSWQVKKFGYKVKEIASLLTGIPIEDFEKQEVKESYLGKEWNYQTDYNKFVETGILNHQMTVRQLLQKIGTDCMRDHLHTNTWVNALFTDYKQLTGGELIGMDEGGYYDDNGYVKFPNWIISDMRFGNEFNAVKDRGGLCVRVIRPNNPYPASDHPSETSLDKGFIFDYEIHNVGDLEDLQKEVETMLETMKIKEI